MLYNYTIYKLKINHIFKKVDTNDIRNYRPIGSLSIPNLIFEKLLCARFVNSQYNIIIDEQYGFRKSFNTSDAINKLMNNVYNSLNDNMYLGALF